MMMLYHFLNAELKVKILLICYLKILLIIFFLNAEKASKLAKIKIAYKKETIKFPPIIIKNIDNGKTIKDVNILLFKLAHIFPKFLFTFLKWFKILLKSFTLKSGHNLLIKYISE